jgi:hypothetical protein
MRKVLLICFVGLLATIGAISLAGAQPEEGQVCPDLDTGHQSGGGSTEITITAPEGQVIVQVCVKSGSAVQGEGPEFIDYDPGVTEATFGHSSGKAISHYSVKYGPVPPPTTTPPEVGGAVVEAPAPAPAPAPGPRPPAPAPAVGGTPQLAG